MKAQCQNCPAKNKRVAIVEIKKGDLVTRRLQLCEECHMALNKLIREQNARDASAH